MRVLKIIPEKHKFRYFKNERAIVTGCYSAADESTKHTAAAA